LILIYNRTTEESHTNNGKHSPFQGRIGVSSPINARFPLLAACFTDEDYTHARVCMERENQLKKQMVASGKLRNKARKENEAVFSSVDTTIQQPTTILSLTKIFKQVDSGARN